MANAWYGSAAIAPDPAPRYSSADQHQHRRGRTKWVVVTAVVVAVLAAASYVGVRAWDDFQRSWANFPFGPGFASGLANLEQQAKSGGTAAATAAFLAAPQAPGSLSVSVLNAKLPKYQWVDGATTVPYSSSKQPVVGISASGTHVVTAVQATRGSCSFGLTITSNADPLIAQDGLSGQGTYYQFAYETSHCVADQAPASSWQLWSPG
jgi:hypothetical protein